MPSDREFVCPKCSSEFEDPDPSKPFEAGILCPECRQRGFAAVGVIHPIVKPTPAGVWTKESMADRLTDEKLEEIAKASGPYLDAEPIHALAVELLERRRASPPPDPTQDPEARLLERAEVERLLDDCAGAERALTCVPNAPGNYHARIAYLKHKDEARAALLDYVCGAERKEKEAGDAK